MKYFIILVFWLISTSVQYNNTARGVFGVRVSIGANSQITSFVCFIDNGHGLSKMKMVDKNSFVKIVTGHWPSIYNPQRIDYFKENDIDCALLIDPYTREKTIGCVPIDSLWKIRFATYPFRYKNEEGWSNKLHKPSLGQSKYLYDEYDIEHIDGDYFLDTNFWKIMNDVVDPDWINNYKSIH